MTDTYIEVAVSRHFLSIDRLVIRKADFKNEVIFKNENIFRPLDLVQLHAPSVIEHRSNEREVLWCTEVRRIIFNHPVTSKRIYLSRKVEVLTKLHAPALLSAVRVMNVVAR